MVAHMLIMVTSIIEEQYFDVRDVCSDKTAYMQYFSISPGNHILQVTFCIRKILRPVSAGPLASDNLRRCLHMYCQL